MGRYSTTWKLKILRNYVSISGFFSLSLDGEVFDAKNLVRDLLRSLLK
jgi:hypothetical protein